MPGSERPRLRRRAALDLSIDEELVRGELRGEALPSGLRRDLAVLVEHELTQAEPLSEKRFLASGLGFGLFATPRRRRLDALVDMNLARREAGAVRPTVAGVAAVTRPAASGDAPPRERLRALRLAEISSILP